MKTILTTFFLAAVFLISASPSLGLNLPWRSDSDAYDWYSFDAPKAPEGLSDEGLSSGQEETGGIWIIDSSGEEKRTTLEMPMGSWARVLMVPSGSGELELRCRYPTGTDYLLAAEEVVAGHAYSAWYQAEWPGEYQVWYTLDGVESEGVRFTVQEGWIAEEGMATPGMTKSAGSGRSGVGAPAMYSYAASPAPASPAIGLAVGGAKDVENFRENIEEGYMPLPTDVTYEGLFYDYYFETGQMEACEKLFCPSYSSAISRDPISGEAQRYLSVGLNSGITDFSREKLNLVVVLDYSGSMGSPFSDYDQFGKRVEIEEDEGSDKTKMEIADGAVVDLLGHLEEDDRFGLVVFSDEAYVVEPLTEVGEKDLSTLEEVIFEIEEYSGTNMEAGMEKGTTAFRKYVEIDPAERENRIIFITDAMPNLGETGEGGLLKILEENADKGIYATFIGVGVDFNTDLAEKITKVRGANYCSVHSAREFEERMDEEFEFMVTPLVFDLTLQLDSPGYRIERVYGSPEADVATGEIMKVNTLFPSRAEEGEVKGGIVLIKLEEIFADYDGEITLRVTYRDRNGTLDGDEAVVIFPDVEPDFYQNDGIRKAVLLSRYADLLKNWIIDEREALDGDEPFQPSVTAEYGIAVPPELGEWERTSLPLTVSEPYRDLFDAFGSYFENESEALGDIDLQQEEIILDKLSVHQRGDY
jgi:Ca-activated chloride channel family protein